jgi:hypothetical protein
MVIDPTTSLIYIWQQGKVRIYERQGWSNKRYRYLRPHQHASFPRGCLPISGTLQAGFFVTSGYATITSPTPHPSAQLNEMQIMHRGVQTTTPCPVIAQSIWDGLAIMGTDGSVKEDTATYSWIISTTQDEIHPDVKGGGLLPPPAMYTDHYSKRPEAAALFAGLSWIYDLLQQFPDTSPDSGPPPSLPIPIDNESVLKDINRLTNDQTPTFQYISPDYDIIQAIQTLIKAMPIAVDIFHVKSHQDRQKPYEELTPYAQINIHADHHAETIHEDAPHLTGLFPTWIPGTRAALFKGKQQVTKDLPTYIRHAKHTPIMREYLIQRSQTATGRDSKWDDTTFDSIAWKPLREAFRKLPTGQRIQLSKFMNDMLPTLKRLQTFDNKIDGRCFECGFLWEDTNHVLCCTGEQRSIARTDAIAAFRHHLQQQHTPDIMTDLLCDSITSWLQRTRIHPPTWHPTEAQLKTDFPVHSPHNDVLAGTNFYVEDLPPTGNLPSKHTTRTPSRSVLYTRPLDADHH